MKIRKPTIRAKSPWPAGWAGEGRPGLARFGIFLRVLPVVFCLFSSPVRAADAQAGSLLITHAQIIDGTGRPAYAGSVRIENGRIAAIGELAPRAGENVLDAGGQVIAPGFIDTHSHLELIVGEDLHVVPAISQGITTIVVGQDGFSPQPLSDWFTKLESTGTGPNIASYAGHNTLRGLVLEKDAQRPASKDETAAIGKLLEREMQSGALGFSTGLEYDTGIYADAAEITALAAVAHEYGGRYITHIRSEDRDFWAALDEAIEVGRQTGIPVQISHIKLSMKGLWGQAGKALERLDAARAEGLDVTADIYPYTYWKSTMTVILPERKLDDREAVEFAFREIAPPDGIFITQFMADPSLVGKSISSIAQERNEDPVTTYISLLQQSERLAQERGLISQDVAAIVAHAMSEDDLATFMRWEHINICSDGERGAHPRAYGAYPRVLARFVRERNDLALESAIQKMTSASAAHMGIQQRGVLQAGNFADLVLFDPETITDHATVADINALSSGISHVWVNGEEVFSNGKAGPALPGKVLRREVK
jgi:N-acyl-D-amino-acid deacylase